MKGVYSILSMIVLFSLFELRLEAQEKSGKFSALMFGDYFYNIQRDSLSTSLNNAIMNDSKDLNGFIYRRIYLTYDYTYNSKITTRINLESDPTTFNQNGKLNFVIKDASFSMDSILSTFSVHVGIMPPPVFNLSEKWWGHRFLEKTIVDLRGICSSRDFGLSINGTGISKKIFYSVMIGNNSGNKLELDRFKTLYSMIGFNPNEKMLMYVSSSYFFLNKAINFYDTILPIQKISKDKILLTFFAGYKKEQSYSFGLEWFTQVNTNNYNTGQEFKTYLTYGATIYASYFVTDKTSLVARYDFFEPNNYSKVKNDQRMFVIAGLNYYINKNFILSPNVMSEIYDKTYNGKNIKPGITPRITFYWKY